MTLKYKCLCGHEQKPDIHYKKLHVGITLYIKCEKCGFEDLKFISRGKEKKGLVI